MTAVCWGFAEDDLAESWSGSYPTRETAIAAGRAEHGPHEFWIRRGTKPSVTEIVSLFPVESFLEGAQENAADHESFYQGSDDPLVFSAEALVALTQLVEGWVAQHVTASGWTPDRPPERIESLRAIAVVTPSIEDLVAENRRLRTGFAAALNAIGARAITVDIAQYPKGKMIYFCDPAGNELALAQRIAAFLHELEVRVVPDSAHLTGTPVLDPPQPIDRGTGYRAGRMVSDLAAYIAEGWPRPDVVLVPLDISALFTGELFGVRVRGFSEVHRDDWWPSYEHRDRTDGENAWLLRHRPSCP